MSETQSGSKEPECYIFFEVDEHSRGERIVFNDGSGSSVSENDLGTCINQLLSLDWAQPSRRKLNLDALQAMGINEEALVALKKSGGFLVSDDDIKSIQNLISFLGANQEKINRERNRPIKYYFRTATDLAFKRATRKKPEVLFNMDPACLKLACKEAASSFFAPYSAHSMSDEQEEAYCSIRKFAEESDMYADSFWLYNNNSKGHIEIETFYRMLFVFLYSFRKEGKGPSRKMKQAEKKIVDLLAPIGTYGWFGSGAVLDRQKQKYPEFVEALEYYGLANRHRAKINEVSFEITDDLINAVNGLRNVRHYSSRFVFDLFFIMVDSCIELGLELRQCEECGHLFFRPYRRRDQVLCGQLSCPGTNLEKRRSPKISEFGTPQLLRKRRMEAARTRFKTVINNIRNKDEEGSARLTDHCCDLMYYQAVSDFISGTQREFWNNPDTDVPVSILTQWIDYPLSIDAKTRRSLLEEVLNGTKSEIELHFKTIVPDPGLSGYRLEDYTFLFKPLKRFKVSSVSDLAYKIKHSSDDAVERLMQMGFLGYQMLGKFGARLLEVEWEETSGLETGRS